MAAGLVFVMRIVWVSARDKDVAATALARSEDRLRRLLVNAADAVVVIDSTGMIVFATEAVEILVKAGKPMKFGDGFTGFGRGGPRRV